MYKINNGLLPSVLNELYKKNNVIHDHNTRTKDMFRVSLGTQTFSTVSARIWNALIVKFNVNVPLTRFKVSLKQYLSSNIRHEIFPEFSLPQRSFSWKSQIRFNIYGGGGGGVVL